MAKKPLPNADTIRQLLDYDPATGALTWRPRTPDMFVARGQRPQLTCANNWNAIFAGKPIGQAGQKGYLVLRLNHVAHLAHRIAFVHYHGRWPAEQIDHINGNRADNRIENLREVSNIENSHNTGIRANNSTGIVGVQYHKRNGKRPWVAGIKVNYQQVYLGSFASQQDAIDARKRAEKEYGFHKNHGARVAVPKDFP